jgi:predicted Zn-dependent peptidase
MVFGGGMTSKLFMHIRETLSLCYAIGSGYHSSKGIMTVSAGIDFEKEDQVRREILAQLEACRRGEITESELEDAKQALCSSLYAIHDSPGAMENYYASAALSGLPLTAEEYRQAALAATVSDLAAAAQTVRLHTVFFLKGVTA